MLIVFLFYYIHLYFQNKSFYKDRKITSNKIIYVLIYDDVPLRTSDYVQTVIEKVYHLKTKTIYPDPEHLRNAYIPARNQYDVNKLFRAARKDIPSDAFKAIIIVNEDIFLNRSSYVLSAGLKKGKLAVVSLKRYNIGFGNVFREKVFREKILSTLVINSIGHTLDIGICDEKCVMKTGNSLLKVLLKTNNFCSSCRTHIDSYVSYEEKKTYTDVSFVLLDMNYIKYSYHQFPPITMATKKSQLKPHIISKRYYLQSFGSKHFLIRYSPSYQLDFIRDLAHSLDSFFDLLHLQFNMKLPDMGDEIRITLHRDEQEKECYIEEYHRDSQENNKNNFVIFSNSKNKDKNEIVMHYFSRKVILKNCLYGSFLMLMNREHPTPPPWLKHGLPQCFANTEVSDDKLYLAINYESLNKLYSSYIRKNEYLPLNTLLQLSQNEWKNADIVAHPEAWAFCYFLLTSDNPKQMDIIRNSFTLLVSKTNLTNLPQKMYYKIISNTDFNELEQSFIAFIDDLCKKHGAIRQSLSSQDKRFKLKGILKKDDKYIALINDDFYKEGEMIDGIRIKQINRDSVILYDNNKDFIILLNN